MRKAIVALVNRALLEVVAEERYAFHALIADFASTLLSKDDENGIYLRHAKYFLKTAKKYTSQNIKNWHKFDLDWNNVRLSLNWLIANTEFSDLGDRVKLELIADFAIALNTLIQIRKPLEGLGWLQAGEQACSLLRRSKDSGWLLLTIGLIELDAGCFDEAITHFEKCETIFESVAETQGLNYVRGNLGLVHHKRGEYSKALQVYEQVLELYQTADDIYASAVICCNQADVYYLIGDLPKAQAQLTKGIALARQKVADTQDLLVKALALNARIQLQCGTVSAAFENSQEAYSIAAQTGSNMLIGVANQSLGEVWASKGDAKIADQRFQKSIELLTEARVQEELAEAKLAYGNFLASNKRKQDAERNLSSAMHIFAQIGAHSRAEKINDILKDLGKK
jgi:tetratricopeptide (TPR) repeat protein